MIGKNKLAEAAATSHPAPANGLLPEYSNHSKHQSNENQGYTPGEKTETNEKPEEYH